MESDQEYSSYGDGESDEYAEETIPDHQMREMTDSPTKHTSSDSFSFAGTEEDESEANEPSSNPNAFNHAKRPADDELIRRPFKRQKGTLNFEYLELLNKDIEDVTGTADLDDDDNLDSTQLGLSFWSSQEKADLFKALRRLGKHDIDRIASRVGSKSALEVGHYIQLLEEEQARRKEQTDPKKADRSNLMFAEYPAAIELSQQCCYAQDEAADAISVRQERREEQREEARWGTYWDITPKAAKEFDLDQENVNEQQLLFARFFNMPRWLQLSQRVFMNSSVPGDNWRFMDDRPPSIWATAFDDFYSLALSITRRLVQTTLFISMSRIRAKRELIPQTKSVVRRKDVEAAIASLGLPQGSQEFWCKSARRLRLKVYEEPPDIHEINDEEPMSYDDIEQALTGEEGWSNPSLPSKADQKEESNSEHDSDALEESGDEVLEYDTSDEENQEIEDEAREVLDYSAIDFPDTFRAKHALNSRIAMERRQEADAERRDEYESRLAESEMWDILQKRPAVEPPKLPLPGPLGRSNIQVENVLMNEREWKNRIQFFSEWETQQTTVDFRQ